MDGYSRGGYGKESVGVKVLTSLKLYGKTLRA